MKEAGLINTAGQRPPPVGRAQGCDFWYTRKDVVTGGIHTIDFIMVTGALGAQRIKSWVDYTNLDSDHHLVGAEVPCPRRVVRRRGRKAPRKRFRLEALIQTSSARVHVDATKAARAGYEESLERAFEGFCPTLFTRENCSCPASECACKGGGRFRGAYQTSMRELGGLPDCTQRVQSELV